MAHETLQRVERKHEKLEEESEKLFEKLKDIKFTQETKNSIELYRLGLRLRHISKITKNDKLRHFAQAYLSNFRPIIPCR